MMKINFRIAFTGLWFLIGIMSCSNTEEASSVNALTINVNTSKPKVGNEQAVVKVSGMVEAASSAKLSTRVMGTITGLRVKVGDRVSQGKLLLSINSADLLAQKAKTQAAIIEAKAGFNTAQKDLSRFKNLFESGSATQKELDDQRANFDMATARLDMAKQMEKEVEAQFSYTNIRAPFAGVITHIFMEKGDLASPGMPLLAIESPSNFEVTTTVSESDITDVAQGGKVDIMIGAINKTIKGNITEVSASSNITGSQYEVKIALADAPSNIRSGMFATVLLPTPNADAKESIYVNSNAIIHKGQLSGIYTVSQSQTAILRWLRLGKENGEMTEVLSGLNADEAYILAPNASLSNGTKVSIQ